MRRKLALWGVALACLALLYVGGWGTYYPGMTGDDAIYLGVGRGLARGEGLVDLHQPGHPPHRKYPPAYPALLAVADTLAPDSLVVPRLFNVALAVLCVGALAALLADRTPAVRWGAVSLFAVNSYWLSYASTVSSEILYTLVLLLYAQAFRRHRPWLQGGLGAAVVYVRAVGVIIPAVGFLAGLTLRDRWRSLVVAAGVAALGILPYVLLIKPQQGYGEANWIQWGNLALYGYLPLIFWGNPWLLQNRLPGVVSLPLSLLGWALVLRGMLRWRHDRLARIMAGLTLATWGVHAVYAYLDFRYFLPVLPFMCAFVAEGARSRAGAVLLAAALLANLAFDGSLVHQSLQGPMAVPHEAAYRWLREHSAPGDRLNGDHPEAWLYTGLPMEQQMAAWMNHNPEPWLRNAYLNHVRWILVEEPLQPDLVRLLQAYPDRFQLAFTEGGLRIFELRGDGARYQQAFGLLAQALEAPPEQGVPLLRQSLALEPRDLVMARLQLALALQRMGQTAEGRAEVEQALRDHPDDTRAQGLLPRL